MKLSKGYFVIGTDTGIGKTYVSTLLFKGVSKIGGTYYKPVQSGAFEMFGKLVSPDVEFMCEFNKIPYNSEMTTYLLKPEVSPHLAAEIDEVEIDPEKIKSDWLELKERYSTIIVEGAGGLYVPIIRNRFYMYDLIKLLETPVILVSSNRVGTINHTMMTINCLKNMGIKVQGIIFNKIEKNFDRTGYENDNIKVIQDMSGIKNMMMLDFEQESFDQEELIRFLELREEEK